MGQAATRTDSKTTGNEFRKKLLEGSAKDIGNRKLNTDASFHDRGAIDAYLDEVVNAIGEKWVYKIYKGEDGKASTHPYYDNEVGDIVYPDENGSVRFLNKNYIAKVQAIEEYIENKVDYIMERAVKSKNLCMDMLDLNVTDYNNFLRPVSSGGNAVLQSKLGMGDDMQQLDGTVDAIKSTPAGSAKQVEMLSKLRIVVRALRDRFVMKDLQRELEEAKKKAGPRTGNDLTAAGDKELNRKLNNRPNLSLTEQ